MRSFKPLPADTLAAKLGAILFTPEQVTNFEPEQVAVLLASDGWSGVIISDRPLWIVYNPRHAPARYESNQCMK